MRAAFYAPLGAPGAGAPSGDKAMASHFIQALKAAGFEPHLASALRSYEGAGDPARQALFARNGAAEAARILRGFDLRIRPRPDLWFTYHLHHKAPDWIGPTVARALGIPYVAAEASLAGKRQEGPFAVAYRATEEALRQAALILALTERDEAGLRAVLGPEAPIERFHPFLGRPGLPPPSRDAARRSLAEQGLDASQPWLLTVAMMRRRAKSESYALLARALARLEREDPSRPWQALIVGDGAAEDAVRAAFGGLSEGRVHFFGRLRGAALDAVYAAADLFLWPGIGEAYGLVYLEAAQAGLPAIACDNAGVAEAASGVLVPPDESRFAEAVSGLLAKESRRLALGQAARIHAARHSFAGAAERLKALLEAVTS